MDRKEYFKKLADLINRNELKIESDKELINEIKKYRYEEKPATNNLTRFLACMQIAYSENFS